MKFSYKYIIGLGLLAATACNPLQEFDDKYAEDAEKEKAALAYNSTRDQASTEYTITTDDYKISSDSVVAAMEAFSAEKEAKVFLPEILNKKFSAENQSVLKVTYNFYDTNPEYYSYNTIGKYTISDADYAFVGDDKFKNFYIANGDYQPAFDKIDKILDENALSAPLKGDVKEVTYKVYIGYVETITTTFNYTGEKWFAAAPYILTDEDYNYVGNGQYDNFDTREGKDEADIAVIDTKVDSILVKNFPDATEGAQYMVTYAIYDGANKTVNALFVKGGSKWSRSELKFETTPIVGLELAAEDYDAMGAPGKYDNFSSSVAPEDYIPTYLSQKHLYAQEGDVEIIKYKYYEGSVIEKKSKFEFKGGKWMMESLTLPVTEDFIFNFNADTVKNSTWVVDPSIKYTLTNDDYALVDNGRYNNFDIRTGKPEADIAVRITKIGTILDNNFEVKEGQWYLVTYKYYDGTNGTAKLKVVKEGGVWKEVK